MMKANSLNAARVSACCGIRDRKLPVANCQQRSGTPARAMTPAVIASETSSVFSIQVSYPGGDPAVTRRVTLKTSISIAANAISHSRAS
jgi:hypothetical protein